MSQNEHTPTPWTLGDADWHIVVGADTRFLTKIRDSGLHETDGTELHTAETSLAAVAIIDPSDNEAEDIANARFLLQAVNSYDARTTALTSARSALSYVYHREKSKLTPDTQQHVLDALKEVERALTENKQRANYVSTVLEEAEIKRQRKWDEERNQSPL